MRINLASVMVDDQAKALRFYTDVEMGTVIAAVRHLRQPHPDRAGRGMTLNDADIAALAREAVDQRSLNLDIRIDPVNSSDPYRWGTAAWTVHAGGASSYITADMTVSDALAKLIADLGGRSD